MKTGGRRLGGRCTWGRGIGFYTEFNRRDAWVKSISFRLTFFLGLEKWEKCLNRWLTKGGERWRTAPYPEIVPRKGQRTAPTREQGGEQTAYVTGSQVVSNGAGPTGCIWTCHQAEHFQKKTTTIKKFFHSFISQVEGVGVVNLSWPGIRWRWTSTSRTCLESSPSKRKLSLNSSTSP